MSGHPWHSAGGCVDTRGLVRSGHPWHGCGGRVDTRGSRGNRGGTVTQLALSPGSRVDGPHEEAAPCENKGSGGAVTEIRVWYTTVLHLGGESMGVRHK